MKKKESNLKRKVIAIALSVITLSSFATMSFTTASAATSSQTITAVVNKNTNASLRNSTSAQKQAYKDIKEIKKFVDDYKEKSEQESKDAKIQKRKDRIEKYASAGVDAVNNIVKGEYVSAVKSVVSLFPYGGIISGVIDLFTSLFTPAPEEPELVPEVSLEDIKEQLDNIDTSIRSLKEAIKQNENNEFYKCMNQIFLVYNSKGTVIKNYMEDKAELLNAKNILEAAKQEKDAEKISDAEKAVEEAEKELNASQKLIDNFFGDENINDFYKLQENLRQCTQYMNGTNFSIKDDKAEGNPFLINFKAKIDGASTGTSIDSIIEQCIKDNEAIWNYYELGITMYSVLAPSYINYLNERGQTDKANANTQEYVSFMTGVYPSGSKKTAYNKINATDVHDYYMTTIIPKMLESSGMYKFKDSTIGEKVAEVSCNGQTEMFKSFDEAWDYATKYTNTKITVFKDLALKRNCYIASSKITNNIELDLQGHTITEAKDSPSKGSLFTINKGEFKVTSSGSNATIKDFSGSSSDSSKNIIINNIKGGLTVENCNFEQNRSLPIYSSLSNPDKLTVKNCVFKNNKHELAGAIRFDGKYFFELPEINVTNCTFENNESSTDGGAIYAKSRVTIENSIFKNNIAPNGKGGAIYTEHSKNSDNKDYFDMNGCSFENNRSLSTGGAVYCYGYKTNIKNSAFTNNKSDKNNGGAIYIYTNKAYLESCGFTNNKANEGNGGAIFIENYISPTIRWSTFTNNYAKKDGGAIYVTEHSDLDISYSDLKNNECGDNGGAIFLGQLASTYHYFRNMTIENNKCGKEGGGVYAQAWGCNTASIKLFGWSKIRYNTNTNGSASNAKMNKSTCRSIFKIMDDFDPYTSDIRGTTNKDGSCMVFLNTSSKYVYRYSYGMQSGAFKADNGRLEQSGSGVYWYK